MVFFVILQIVFHLLPKILTSYKHTKLTFMLLLSVIYVILGVNLSSPLRNTVNIEPMNKSYNHDGLFYLKVYYQMKKGSNYYDSLKESFLQDKRNIKNQVPQFWFGWRSPVIYYLFKLFQRPSTIIYVFVFLSLVSILCIFLWFRKLTSFLYSITAVSFLIPYFLYGASSMWFMFMEYWGLFFFVFGITAYIYKYFNLSVLFLCISVFIRELYLILLFGLFLSCIFKRDFRYSIKLIGIVLLFSIFLAFHINNVIPYLDSFSIFPANGITLQMSGGLSFVYETIIFGKEYYLFRPIVFLYFLFGLQGQYNDCCW